VQRFDLHLRQVDGGGGWMRTGSRDHAHTVKNFRPDVQP
jgi:hypothetical protein